MRSAVAGLLVALVLFVAGAAAWSQARLARSVADAHQRLATLNLDEADGIDAATTAFSLLPWPTGSLSEDIRQHRANVAYWRSEYRQLASASPSGRAWEVSRNRLPGQKALRRAAIEGSGVMVWREQRLVPAANGSCRACECGREAPPCGRSSSASGRWRR